VVPLARLDVAIGRYESDGLLVLTSAEEHYAVANVPVSGARSKPMAVSALRARYVEDLRRRYPEAEMEALGREALGAEADQGRRRNRVSPRGVPHYRREPDRGDQGCEGGQ